MKIPNRFLATFEVARRTTSSLAVFGAISILFSIMSALAMGFTAYWSYESHVEERLNGAARSLESVGRYVTDQYSMMDLASLRMIELIDKRDPKTISTFELREFKKQIEAPSAGRGLEVQVWFADGVNALAPEENISIVDDEAFRAVFFANEFVDGAASLRHATSGLTIARPIVGRIRNIPVLPVSRAITNSDNVMVGLVTVTLPTVNFLSLFSTLRSHENDALVLARNDYLGMVREPNTDMVSGRYIPSAIIFQNYPKTPKGRYEGAAISDGVRRVGVHLTLSPLPLVLGYSLEVAAIGWTSLRHSTPLLIVGIVQFTFAIGFSFIAFWALRRLVNSGRRVESARLRAEENATQLNNVLISANDGVIILDGDLRVRMFNRSAEKTFGISNQEILGGTIDRLIPADSRARHAILVNRFVEASDGTRAMGSWRQVRALRASGEAFPASVSVTKSTLRNHTTYLVILRDMTDAEKSEIALVKAVEQQSSLRMAADKANRAKSDFLAAVSHELRTPLNAIIGFSEILQRGAGGKDLSAHLPEYLGYIHQSGEHLLSLINDILDLTRVQRGAVQLHIEEIALLPQIEEAIRMSRSLQDERNVCVDISGVSDTINVHADSRAIRQVLINLIGNAVKFSPENGHVTIDYSSAGEKFQIRIADRGPGMPAELIAKIGEPFLQEDNSYVKTNSGSGLGLAISAGLLRAMDGDLIIRNRNGGGLEAIVQLPFNPGGFESDGISHHA
jgi:PAS domain S-box-containing protein